MSSKKARAERVAKDRKRPPPQEKAPQLSADHGRLPTVLCIALALATLAVYAQTFRYGFVLYDDDQYVFENPMVKAGLTASGVGWALTTFYYANWHPLTWISYMLDAQLFGIDASAFHAVNVLLHAASAVLLFLALFGMTRQPWRCAVVAGVFALHPLHVESVAWVSERKDVLSTFLEMIALLLYARYVERPNLKRYLPVLLAFALGVMAKPMLVTFPFVLLLLDYWPLRRIQWPLHWANARRVFAEKAPLLAMSIVASAFTFAAQRNYGAVASLERMPMAARLGNVAIAYVVYIKQAFWPSNLGVLYPAAPPDPGFTGIAVLILVAVTALVLLFAPKRPYLFTGWFWYLGILVPVIGIIQVGVQSRADRYMYVPLVGLTIMLVWAAADWLELHPVLRRPAAVVAGAVLIVFALGAWRQAGYWKDSRTLFEHTLTVTERNHIIRNNLGVILARDGDVTGAIDQHRQALAINPDYADAHANLGHELLRAGQYEASRTELLDAIRLNPDLAMAHADLGLLDAAAGNFPGAISHLNESLRLAPDVAEPHSNLCFALEHSGRMDEAIVQCREALRLKPDFPDAERNLKNALGARQ